MESHRNEFDRCLSTQPVHMHSWTGSHQMYAVSISSANAVRPSSRASPSLQISQTTSRTNKNDFQSFFFIKGFFEKEIAWISFTSRGCATVTAKFPMLTPSFDRITIPSKQMRNVRAITKRVVRFGQLPRIWFCQQGVVI